MSLFPSVTIQILRVAPGAYSDGHWTDGAPAVLMIQGSVHPASGKTLQSLPEGDRTSEAYEIYSDESLQQSDPATQTRSDLLTFQAFDGLVDSQGNLITDNNGVPIALSMPWPFKVIRVRPWQNGILPHYETVAIRIKEGGSP